MTTEVLRGIANAAVKTVMGIEPMVEKMVHDSPTRLAIAIACCVAIFTLRRCAKPEM